ncbi:hypothetical protein PSAC2689_10172 [Paraburkholderia sacchari]
MNAGPDKSPAWRVDNTRLTEMESVSKLSSLVLSMKWWRSRSDLALLWRTAMGVDPR